MSIPRDSKPFPGTQSDTYSYDRGMKPADQPPCDRPDQHQFSDNESARSFGSDNYYETARDKWNNELVPDERSLHREATAGLGMGGDRQFAANSQDVQSTGYGKNLGLNVIEYDQSAAFQTPEKVVVDASRADRGRES